MRLLTQLLFPSVLLLSLASSSDLVYRLEELGLGGFSQLLVDHNPTLLRDIQRRNDVTVWAPGNAVVAAYLAATRKRDASTGARLAGQTDHTPPDPLGDKRKKRQAGEGPPGYPDTNFQTIYTFLKDPTLVNMGPSQPVRYVKNFAIRPGGAVDATAKFEVVTGFGDIQWSVRGPFKFKNGVIYEVDNFFTIPEKFTPTMTKIGIAESFYNEVVSAGKLSLFEETPGVTIFAPIDSPALAKRGNQSANTDPAAHIVTTLYNSGALDPPKSIFAHSGAEITISWAENGERLVNCRRLLKANVPTQNGIIHFIDGPLYGDDSCYDE